MKMRRLGRACLRVLMIAVAAAALSACGDDTSMPPPSDMSISPYDCGLCGRLPPDLKKGD